MSWDTLGWFCSYGGKNHYAGTGNECIGCGKSNYSGIDVNLWVTASTSTAVMDKIRSLETAVLQLEIDQKIDKQTIMKLDTDSKVDRSVWQTNMVLLEKELEEMKRKNRLLEIKNDEMCLEIEHLKSRNKTLKGQINVMKQKAKKMFSGYLSGLYYLDPIFY